MSVFVLNIRNEEKGKRLLDFLKTIEFVDIEERPAQKAQKSRSKVYVARFCLSITFSLSVSLFLQHRHLLSVLNSGR